MKAETLRLQLQGPPLMTKLESIASSAVRAADKVGAALIIVYTQSGTSFCSAFEYFSHVARCTSAGPLWGYLSRSRIKLAL